MSNCGKSWWDDAEMYAEAFGEGLGMVFKF